MRSGHEFSAYASTDGDVWTLIGTETIPLPTRVYVGLAITSHAAAKTSTATLTDLTVTATGVANVPPTVSLTSPASGATYTAPASIAIAASAADSDGTVSRVDFYRASTLIGTDTTSPYTVTWSGVPAGTYSLTARATDNSGATRTSAAVSVTVVAAQATMLAFNPSSDHGTNVDSYSVSLFRASDPPTGTPVATTSLGKPAVVNNDISVNISSSVDPLPAGSYYAVVSATNLGGSTPSVQSASFVK